MARRRLAIVTGDLTVEEHALILATASECGLCDCELTDESDRPNSKHTDHIVPICIGGAHSRGNVRILCRTCNLSRPKYGEDIGVGQLAFPVDALEAKKRYSMWIAERRDLSRAKREAQREESRRRLTERKRMADMRRQKKAGVALCRDLAKKLRRAITVLSTPPPRPRACKYGPEVLEAVRELRVAGLGYKRIGRELGVSRDTARNLVRRAA